MVIKSNNCFNIYILKLNLTVIELKKRLKTIARPEHPIKMMAPLGCRQQPCHGLKNNPNCIRSK